MRSRLLVAAAMLALAAPAALAAQSQDSSEAKLQKTVADYVGLYQRGTLDQWEKLFLPSFSAANTRADGTTSMRTREEFFASQRRYHERAEVTERLENVRMERNGRLASIWADFIVNENGKESRGRLVLLAIEDASEWKFHSLMFGYNR